MERPAAAPDVEETGTRTENCEKGCREARSCEACGAQERVELETVRCAGIGSVRGADLWGRRGRRKLVGANARFSVDRVAERAGARGVRDGHDGFSTRDVSPTAV